MAHSHDLDDLLAEMQQDPAVAERIVTLLHGRVQALQRTTDELRVELALLQRGGAGGAAAGALERLQTELRDLRAHARRADLDFETLALVAADGRAMHVPMPAPLEQTLALTPPPGETLRDLRPIYAAPSTRLGALLTIGASWRFHLVDGLRLPVSEHWAWADAAPVVGDGRERVEAVCAIDPSAPPREVLVVSRSGWCRAIPWRMVENMAIGGATLTAPARGDAPVWIGPVDGGDVVLATRLGQCVRFPLAALAASGELGISLDPDDDVAGAAVFAAPQSKSQVLHVVAADGRQIIVSLDALDAHKRPGGRSRALARSWTTAACFAQSRRATFALFGMNGDVRIGATHAVPVADRPHEARPLDLLGQRLLTAAYFGG
jgi:hypothetical protein